MGERANIAIRSDWPRDLGEKEAVFLYTHWGREGLPEILRAALVKRARWDDEQYLARIVFDMMVGDHQGELQGMGISSRLGDNEGELLVLFRQRVYLLPEDVYEATGFLQLREQPSISFENYIGRGRRTWENTRGEAVAGE